MRGSSVLAAVGVAAVLIGIESTPATAHKADRTSASAGRRGGEKPRWKAFLREHPEYGTRRGLTGGFPAWPGQELERPAGSKPKDPSRRPVFVTPGNGDSVQRFEPVAQALMKAGYPSGHFYGVSYGDGVRPGAGLLFTLSLLGNSVSPELVGRVERAFRASFHHHYGVPVEQAEPHMKFDMIGHSMGVPILMNMLLQSGLDTRVHRFINVAGAPNGGMDWIPPASVLRNSGMVGKIIFRRTPLGMVRSLAWSVGRQLWNPVLNLTADVNPLRKVLDAVPATSKATGVANDSEPMQRILKTPLKVHEVVSLRGENDLLVSKKRNRYPHGGREGVLRGLDNSAGYLGGDHEVAGSDPRIAKYLLDD